MTRTVFAVDDLLDAARSCVLSQGIRKTTVASVARASGAPVGSIYHRFAGIDDVLAGVWMRAVTRSHDAFDHLDDGVSSPVDDAVTIALASYDFCTEHTEDVMLLERLTRRDVFGLKLSASTLAEVRAVDERGLELMGLAGGRLGDASMATAQLIVIEIPQTFARSAVSSPRVERSVRRAQLGAAVRAVMDAGAVTSAPSAP